MTLTIPEFPDPSAALFCPIIRANSNGWFQHANVPPKIPHTTSYPVVNFYPPALAEYKALIYSVKPYLDAQFVACREA